jgi:hypothetical protein
LALRNANHQLHQVLVPHHQDQDHVHYLTCVQVVVQVLDLLNLIAHHLAQV